VGKHVGDRGYFYEPTILLNTSPAKGVNAKKSSDLFFAQCHLKAPRKFQPSQMKPGMFGCEHLDT
jgi:hypothetical protein